MKEGRSKVSRPPTDEEREIVANAQAAEPWARRVRPISVPWGHSDLMGSTIENALIATDDTFASVIGITATHENLIVLIEWHERLRA